MEQKELAVQMDNVVESVVMGGDLSKLTPQQRVSYYKAVCESIGLNPLTRPFDYITLKGKLTLYARKDATDQLRKIHGVSIDDVQITEVGDTWSVKVKGHDATGRSDVEIGVVSKKDMEGNSANVQMKAVTKAKRRLTLSLCGLGMLDETELETIPGASITVINESGEIEPAPAEMSLDLAYTVKSSDGKFYCDLTDDELNEKLVGLRRYRKTNPQKWTDEHALKLSAAEVLLKERQKAK